MSNDLIKLGGNLESPRDSKATDWPNVGASGPAGQASGQNQLIKLTQNKVEGFTVSKSKSNSTSLSIKGSVDLATGQMSPNAEEQTY